MTTHPELTVSDLTCNYLRNPLGVETASPRLSWELKSSERGQRQTAYRVLVSSRRGALDEDRGDPPAFADPSARPRPSPTLRRVPDLWDSGKVESAQSVHVPYAGQRLKSRQGCHWKVCVWDRDGRQSAWSEAAYWEMGLLRESDWRAQWITGAPVNVLPANYKPQPAPMLRRSFKLDAEVVSARAYVCGLGYYELSINGQKVGDEALAPGFTRYDKTALYQTHDVTAALRPGENVVGAILGNGWYNCFTPEVWNFQQAPWRDHPKLLLQMHIRLADGEDVALVSDGAWRWSTGPIVFDGLRNGEYYDARLEKPDWDAPGYDDSDWKPAVITRGPGGALRSQQMTPIRVTGTLRPVSLREVQPGVWVYDLGQNIAGWAQLTFSGPAGTTVTLKYAEKLKPDGDIDPSNINTLVKGGEFQTDRYTLKGQGVEVWQPRFTYHGFQYVQVTGFPGAPTLESLAGRVVHTAFDTRGEFACSNELLNKIQACTRWATLGNYHGIPTDCPHREKNGWTGDAQLSAEQALLNFDPMTCYRKWMADFRDVQRPSGQLPGIVPTGGWGFNWGSGPAWDSAAVLIPWYLYLYCGDTTVLAEHYECMKRYVEFTETMATDHIVNFGLGDWCPPHSTGGGGYKCPATVTDTAYFYVDTCVLAKTAALLGKSGDAKRFEKLAAKIRAAFRKRFLELETGKVTGNCQTSIGCALYQGLVDAAEQPKVLAALVAEVEAQKRHIDCGILGAKYVMHALTELGRADLAYAIATQTDFPSWGHWIAQGATTLWESWHGNSSRNHHMFGDISAWFYKGLAGISPDPAAPGFQRVLIRPNPVGDLKWVRAWHRSPYGRIVCNWSLSSGTRRSVGEGGDGEFTLDLTIPPNSTATVFLPTSDPASVRESGQPASQQPGVRLRGQEAGRVVLDVDSGEYRFTARP